MNHKDITEEILAKADAKLNEMADFIFSKSQENIHRDKIDNTGHLATTANVNRRFLVKEIVYPAPYAAPVEFGTDPHMPPVKPLQKWAKKKLGLSEKEAKKVGWGVAMKIKKEGTEPKPFLRPAVEEAKEAFAE